MVRKSVTLAQLLGMVTIKVPSGRHDEIIRKLNKLEETMAGLKEQVQALKDAVDGVAQRLLPRLEALESVLDSTKQQLAAALSDDAAAAEVLADANAAAADIRTEVDRLNALGNDPTTPVDTNAPGGDVPEVQVPAGPTPDAPAETTGELPSTDTDEDPVVEPPVDESIPADVEQGQDTPADEDTNDEE